MPRKNEKRLVLKIKGQEWAVRLISKKKLEKIHKDCLALCRKEEKEIIFTPRAKKDLVIRHEVFHAYASYQYIDELDLSHEQLEEVYADMISYDLEDFLKTCNQIKAFLKK